MKNNTSKILVIGGSGFVGSRLLSEVDRSKFINLDKKQSPFFKEITVIQDITDIKNLAVYFKDISAVVLLAAEHRDDVSPKSRYYDVNVEGTKNVLKCMDLHSVKKLIFTSSVAIYGLNKNNPDENTSADPFNHYGKSKWQAEQSITKWYDKDPDNKSVIIIRPTVIFGERNRGNVYNLLKTICSGKFLMIGNGTNKKSMAYVGNVACFIKQFVKNKDVGYNVYNYADNPDLNMQQLTLFVEKHMNIKIPKIKIPYFLGLIAGYLFDLLAFIIRKNLTISSVRIKKFCATTQFNATKVNSFFKAPITLEEGLYNTIEFEFVKNKKDEVLFFSE